MWPSKYSIIYKMINTQSTPSLHKIASASLCVYPSGGLPEWRSTAVLPYVCGVSEALRHILATGVLQASLHYQTIAIEGQGPHSQLKQVWSGVLHFACRLWRLLRGSDAKQSPPAVAGAQEERGDG